MHCNLILKKKKKKQCNHHLPHDDDHHLWELPVRLRGRDLRSTLLLPTNRRACTRLILHLHQSFLSSCVNITIVVRVKSTDRFNSNKKSSSALHLSENMALLVDRLSLLLFFQHCNRDDKQPPPSRRCPQTTLVAFFGFPLAAFPPTGPTPWNFFWANVVFLPWSSSPITFILCLNSSTTCFSFARLLCTRSATWTFGQPSSPSWSLSLFW